MAVNNNKVYLYTRVSTSMQIDGYSLSAQKARMQAYAEFNGYEIAGEYEDAGKSGKSIEGRASFNRMIEDIKTGKDHISYVLVFKLSRFGRNAADVLSTLQVMQDFGVNLICVEDGIDSSKDAGKLIISVLSAVAEIERDNIRVQTMEGRIQKAKEGKWNGGFAPYGYRLVNGMLEINEEEAIAIRTIFYTYINTPCGANGVSKYLYDHGIEKVKRQNGHNNIFDASLIRKILRNPVYCGKIAYGRKKLEKVHGTRNEYRHKDQEDYILVDGLHEAIVPEEVWNSAQDKLETQSKKYEKISTGDNQKIHLLSGLVKCPVCGAGMYSNVSIKHKKDGTKYKDFYYYACKHRLDFGGTRCDYHKQINEELLDSAVIELISKVVNNPAFAEKMCAKIDTKIDTAEIDSEIESCEKKLRQCYSAKDRILKDLDCIDEDDRHYDRIKSDYEDRLYNMYDRIEETEQQLVELKSRKAALEKGRITCENIYYILEHFEKIFHVANDVERRSIVEMMISDIQVYPERQENGQWLKSVTFKLPILEDAIKNGLDLDTHVETVALLSKLSDTKNTIEINLDLSEIDLTSAESKATYNDITEYVMNHYGLHVTNLNIAQVKRKCGIIERDNYNHPKSENSKQPNCTKEKEAAIKAALKHFNMI